MTVKESIAKSIEKRNQTAQTFRDYMNKPFQRSVFEGSITKMMGGHSIKFYEVYNPATSEHFYTVHENLAEFKYTDAEQAIEHCLDLMMQYQML